MWDSHQIYVVVDFTAVLAFLWCCDIIKGKYLLQSSSYSLRGNVSVLKSG